MEDALEQLAYFASLLGCDEVVLFTDKISKIEKEVVVKYKTISAPVPVIWDSPVKIHSLKYMGVTVHLYDKNQTKKKISKW